MSYLMEIGLAIAILVALLIAWFFAKIVIRRYINYTFSALVAEGNLSKALQYFEKITTTSPLTLAYNSTLVEAAINSNFLESNQSPDNLRRFFENLADSYLLIQPYSSFANIFAAGIKRYNNPKLSAECIMKAMQYEPHFFSLSSLITHHMACLIARDFDVCLSIYLASSILQSFPKRKYIREELLSLFQALTGSLSSAGAIDRAEQCCQEVLSSEFFQPLSRSTEVYFTYYSAFFQHKLGHTPTYTDRLTSLETIDYYTPSLFISAALFCLSRHDNLKAMQCMHKLKSVKEISLPLWITDGVTAYISVISYINNLLNSKEDLPDDDMLMLCLKNLKDAADSYHDSLFMQILAADGFFCAGHKHKALLYLERANKLPNQIVGIGSEPPDDWSPDTYGFLLGLSESLAIPFFSAQHYHENLKFKLYKDLGRGDEALALCLRQLREDDRLPANTKANWLLNAAEAAHLKNQEKQANEYLHQAEQLLDKQQAVNHIKGAPIPASELMQEITKPRCFGSIEYHFNRARQHFLDKKYDEATQSALNVLSCCPYDLNALRLLGELAKIRHSAKLAQVVCTHLEKCYVAVEDLLLISELELLQEIDYIDDFPESAQQPQAESDMQN